MATSRMGMTAARLCVAATLRNTQVAGLKTGGGPLLKKTYAEVPKALKEKMQQFQIDNGLPVHVKGGPVDKILYLATAVVCTWGFIDCWRVYIVLSYPEYFKKD
ncbi:hypothetical protein Pmani_036726 [Petrolisthes manimaculis]|uniref:Uncharacterized protein n=1 Tax=Petrolisthes manimaculis TaxID=1843537 RepID=A0AAE1TME2_9EUCA|nr:hypothetical protein Pmani_036726 [Petrolisthes manimaculis]